MTRKQRDELRRLAEKATPGPWHHRPATCSSNQRAKVFAGGMVRGHDRGHTTAGAVFTVTDDKGRHDDQCTADVEFAAAAHPQAVLSLLDALDAAERERDAYRKAKQENDERFQTERDAARAEADRIKEAVEWFIRLTTANPDSKIEWATIREWLTDFAAHVDRWRDGAAEAGRLRAALVKLRDCDWVITLPDRMDAVREIARTALEGE